MAADTNTPILNLLLQGTGNNSNSWGTNLNDSVITPLENAVAGCLTISGLTGGAYTLTQANAVYGTIKLQGTLASDLTITVPSTANNWRFVNELVTAGFYVLIKKAAGVAVNIPHGKLTEISTDGTTMYRHDEAHVGELFYHAGTAVPGGALECTGATPLRASALDLFAKIGTTWGVGNGTTTYTIPDGYTAGKFLRSRTASVALGTAQANANKAHTHALSGIPGLGTLAVDAGGAHTPAGSVASSGSFPAGRSFIKNPPAASGYVGYGGTEFGADDAAPTITITSTFSGTAVSAHTHAVSGAMTAGTLATVTDGGTEARPENLSAILCIRY